MPVDSKTTVQVVWSRGNKKAKTKGRLINEKVHTALIDEKFQINTAMELDPTTEKPTKSKTSMLTVSSTDKNGEVFGQVELDLSTYGDREFATYKKELTNSKFPGAYIEVGLKGVPAAQRATP